MHGHGFFHAFHSAHEARGAHAAHAAHGIHPSMLQLAVLAVAERAPVSGKAFAEKIAEVTQNGWRISSGLVYPLLRRMEEKEFLKAEISVLKAGERGRREIAYALTPKGRRFLRKARSGSKEHLNKIMSRMAPLAMFVCFGEDEPEFLELVKKVRLATNERVWRAAALGGEKRLTELRRLISAIEKT